MNDAVQEALGALLDEETRRTGAIALERIERVIDEYQLSAEAGLALYERLSERGIGVVVDEEESAADEDFVSDPVATAEEDPSGSRNLVRSCLGEIGSFPLLRPEEEVELARSIAEARRAERALRKGEVTRTAEVVRTIERGIAAKRRMVLANMRLVLSVARKHQHRSDLDLLDLVQEGAAGLIRGAERFDPERGFRFATYAIWWVRQAINRAIAEHGRSVRIPIRLADEMRRLRRAERRLRRERRGKEPERDELARALGWDSRKLALVEELARMTTLSLEAEVPGTEELTLGDTLEAETPDPEELYTRIELANLVEDAIETLTTRERAVIAQRFGLAEGGEERTLEEVGQRLGVSRERVRQIQAKALEKLRQYLEGHGLRRFA